MIVTLKKAQSRLNIIQVYAKSDKELKQFYIELQQALEVIKSRDVTMIMGDLNLKSVEEVKVILLETLDWAPQSPADNQHKVIRNQIDYLLICKRYRNSIKSVKSYPGADVGSDHNSVVGRFRINLKKLVAKTKVEGIQVFRLRDPSTKERVTLISVSYHLLKSKEELNKIEIITTEDANRKWHMLKDALISTCETTLTLKLIKNKNEWMTDEILHLMEARRSYKTKDKNKYNIIHTEMRRNIRDAKEIWYSDKCEEIEQLVEKHDNLNPHKRIIKEDNRRR
ncbi:uncharacterized protein [Diabrotica undecimpunctata]|uniref:uncharacterized protein n=1 Tax=Diabrotica undecimpunctata TaxID=50387 RepID=UPI003B6392D6